MKKLNTKSALMKGVYNGGGAIAAAAINKVGIIGKQKAVVRGIGKLVIGAFLPSMLGKGKKSEVVEQAVAGWNGIAALELANGILTKNGSDPTKAISIAGIGDVNPNILGMPDQSYDMDIATEVQDENAF
jgi:hypothetical protein